MKVDFTQKDFDFISNHGEYYIEGPVECTGDYTVWTDQKKSKMVGECFLVQLW